MGKNQYSRLSLQLPNVINYREIVFFSHAEATSAREMPDRAHSVLSLREFAAAAAVAVCIKWLEIRTVAELNPSSSIIIYREQLAMAPE
jgi:hypothetical protein